MFALYVPDSAKTLMSITLSTVETPVETIKAHAYVFCFTGAYMIKKSLVITMSLRSHFLLHLGPEMGRWWEKRPNFFFKCIFNFHVQLPQLMMQSL